jgi:hypothetical protein
MKLGAPVDLSVVEKRSNGAGVIEIPVLPVAEIDLSRTAGGGDGKVPITVEVLQEIASNFADFPGPVPVGVQPHEEYGDRAGFSPGFVNALSVRDDMLYAEVELVAELFEQVLAGGWRGFSVEIAKDLKTATRELEGWALTGGVFTNRPATDVNFRIAASQKGEADSKAIYATTLATEDLPMADDKIASLEAELATQKELVTSLRTQTDSIGGEQKALEAKLTEVNKDLAAANIALSDSKAKAAALDEEVTHLRKTLKGEQQTRRETEIKLEAEQNRALRESVIELAGKAIDRGVSAKHFEGLEEDPAAWFNKRFVSLEALSQFIDALPTVKQSATTSGQKSDAGATVSAETAEKFRGMGIDPDYANVSTLSEFQKLKARKEDKK